MLGRPIPAVRVAARTPTVSVVVPVRDNLAGARLTLDGVIVPPGWLFDLAAHLDDPAIGLVGPANNRGGPGARVPASYTTYGEMVAFARQRREGVAANPARDVDVPDVFCVALRRDVLDAVGVFDERLEIGRFAADYARRVRAAGYRVACAFNV